MSYDNLLLYAKDAARMLGISARTLERLSVIGEGPPKVRISARRIGYRRAEVLAFAEAAGGPLAEAAPRQRDPSDREQVTTIVEREPVASVSAGEIGEFPRDSLAGVYLLVTGHVIAYVGTSRDILARIRSHRKNGRAFDRAYMIPVHDDDERCYLEAMMIRQMAPKWNRLKHLTAPAYLAPAPRVAAKSVPSTPKTSPTA
jgi:hypothetical protein